MSSVLRKPPLSCHDGDGINAWPLNTAAGQQARAQRSEPVTGLPAGWGLGQADECVDSQVLQEERFEPTAVDEFLTAGAVGEVLAGLPKPRSGDGDSVC